ncbi:hypothetical protein B0H14DRAFT_2583308 [Mycena olivaceomarginata]|nr:hypothetical protein B0H14DRAFT_2583308 [Mycena olivaceomarginata]
MSHSHRCFRLSDLEPSLPHGHPAGIAKGPSLFSTGHSVLEDEVVGASHQWESSVSPPVRATLQPLSSFVPQNLGVTSAGSWPPKHFSRILDGSREPTQTKLCLKDYSPTWPNNRLVGHPDKRCEQNICFRLMGNARNQGDKMNRCFPDSIEESCSAHSLLVTSGTKPPHRGVITDRKGRGSTKNWWRNGGNKKAHHFRPKFGLNLRSRSYFVPTLWLVLILKPSPPSFQVAN